MEEWILKTEAKYRYMLLDRLRQDCEYYFGNGGKNPRNLCTGSEEEQIEEMVGIWNSFPDEDKPEWLTMEQIVDYAQRMGVDINKYLGGDV